LPQQISFLDHFTLKHKVKMSHFQL